MLTQEQALAELRQVNRELGLPEDDGVPMTRAQVEAELLKVDQELASTPESFSEFSARRKKEADRSFGEDLSAFGGAFWDGAGMIAEQAGKAWDEKGNVSLNVAKQTLDLGWDDFKRFANTLGGAAMDKLPGVSEEEELRREYARYVTNFEYNTRIRAEKLEKLENRALSDFGANFVDPLLFVPVSGVAAKGGALTAKGLQSVASAGAKAAGSRGLTVASKVAGGTAATLGGVAKVADLAGTASSLPSRFASTVVRKGMKGAALGGSALARAGARTGELVATAAGAPRKGVAWVAGKLVPASSRDLAGAGAFGGQIVGAMTGAIPGALPLSIAEASGFIAGRTGRAAQEILRVFAQPSGNSRFLYRLATDSSLSPAMRSLALRTYQMGGSKAGDAMFNMLVNGTTVGALNGALAYAAGEAAEGIGAAAGAGALMGGVLPIGQPNARGGKSQSARDARSIDNYMKSKIVSDQRKHFNKLPQKSQLMLATMAESGVGAPKVMILPKTEYLEAASGVDSAGFYSPEERIVTVNASRLSEGGEYAVNTVAHEVGHDFVKQSLGDDPAMLRLLLEDFETAPDEGEAFYFQYTPDGTPIGDPIYLNETAQRIRTDYDRRIRGAGIGQNASKLAQEIGADQFSMLFSGNPNAFEQFHPRLRRRLLDGARRTLSALGMVNAETGNTLTNTISKRLLGNPGIARLYKNYGAARSYELLEKGEATDVGVLVEPARGQTGEDRFQQLFGGVGISLAEGKNLRVTDKRLFEELKSIRDRYEDSAPEGWGVTKQGWLAGKKLTDELYTLFTRNDRFGNVANLIDAATEAIAQRIGVRFGYRSGTKGNYQNPFKIRDVGLYGFLISPMRFSGGKNAKRQTRPTLKVVGYDEAKLRHNVEVMVQEGIVKDPKAFLQRLAALAQEALQDPEGRINPDGRKENEDLTVAFGMKGSTENIASPRLRELLENKKIKDTFVSYDLEAMAGLSKGRNKAFVFDYENIRDNYSPFFYAAGKMPQHLPAAAYHGTPHTFKAEEGAPLGRFRSSQIGTGEGAQAYGHGLYFAGKKEVAEHYRKTLVREENPNKWKEKPGTESFDEQVSFILDDAASISKTNAEFLKDLEALETRATSGEYQYSPSEIFYIKKAVSLVKNGDVELAKGSLYKVELAPKENEYLYWDKPLSEQPKGVREKLAKVPLERVGLEVEASPYDFGTAYFLKKIDGGRIGRVDSSTKTLADIKNLSVGNWMDAVGKTPQTSAALKEAGIPGIKYLDGSSRSKGKGDYNYVIFDEADVAITDKLFMPAAKARKKLKDLEQASKNDPLDDPSRNHVVQASLLQGIIDESQGGKELDTRVSRHRKGEGSTYIEYTSESGDSFKIRATDHDRQLSSITNHRRPDFTLASSLKNVSEASGDWIDAVVRLENETDFQVPARLESRIRAIVNRREEIRKIELEIARQERLQDERARQATEAAKAKLLKTPEGRRISGELDALRLELQSSGGTGKYTRKERQSMYKKVRKLEDKLSAGAATDKLFMPASELKKEFGAKQAEEIQYRRLFMPSSKEGEDYRGYHKAPDRDNGAPLHDVTSMYPSDIYGPNGARYYGTGDSAMDAKSIAIIQEMYGNPDGEVTIYRAVPEFADEIRPNDWVTIVREYAELHGESGNAGGDGYKILSEKVKASELFTEANSLHEWGWSPEGKSSKQFMPADRAPGPPDKQATGAPKSIRKALAGEPGGIASRAVTIDKALAERLFMPAAAAYFDPGFSPDTYVGKKAFPMMADRMKTGTHVTRSNNEYELRGGPDHPDMPINQGKVAWASMAGGQAAQLQNAINRTDGIGLVTLMAEDALASNRTFARIIMDELRYDFENNPKARKALPKRIKDAAKAVRKWAKNNENAAYKDFNVETLGDLEAVYPKLSFDVRKLLFKKIAAIDYKRKVGGIFWLDLVRELSAYKNEDGYRTGDIVKVIQFDQGDSVVNLADLGISPDPTYDVSFKGRSISNVKGRVSAFQVFRDSFDMAAKEANKPGRTMTSEGKVGPYAFRTMQMRGLTDPNFTREMSPGSLEARNYAPIKFSAKTAPERASLEVRALENLESLPERFSK